MRIFVAGATGVIGCRLVPRLTAAGHSVTGLTRTPAKTADIRHAGGEPVVADALDADAVLRAVTSAQPEVIVHQMTALRGAFDLRRFDRTFAMSNRLRTEGLDNLIAAARRAGTPRMVVQSFCGWPYARTGGAVKSEDAPLETDPPTAQRRSLAAIRYLEDAARSAAGIQALVLRYAVLYGPGTGMLDPAMVEQLRHRRVPLIGTAEGWWSFLHVEDAATAAAAAAVRGTRGIYNIVDDEPAPAREWLPALAAALGAKRPYRVPKWLALPLAGRVIVEMMTEARAGSNAKAKRELGWQPAFPSWRQGFARAAGQRP